MRRFLAACLEMASLWISPPPPLGMRLWTVIWCEGFDAGRRRGRRVRGASAEMHCCDTRGAALSKMCDDGAAEMSLHGGKGVIVMLDPDGELAAIYTISRAPPPRERFEWTRSFGSPN